MKKDSLKQKVEGLVEILEAQAADFTRLLEHIAQGEDAVRSANVNRLLETCQQERVVAGRLAELERHRANLIKEMSRILSPKQVSEGPMRTAEICKRLPEAMQPRVQKATARLRSLAEETGRRSAILRAAATTLCRHMGGVIQAVNTSLGKGTTTYGRRGRIESPEVLHAVLDIRR
ncbi:MAG: flagellar export chaperone FlgN [Phycisphaerales bacterium]|nr:flagellar export chaperone FlgN [Phycisphaerales bacterium]